MSDGTPADAGSVAVGVAVGGSLWGVVRWLFTWTDRRAIRRDGRLQAWEDSLVGREKAYREEIEHQLATLREAHDRNREDIVQLRNRMLMLRGTVIDLVVEIRVLDPKNAALARAEQALKTAFPPEHDLPGDMINLAAQLNGGKQ